MITGGRAGLACDLIIYVCLQLSPPSRLGKWHAAISPFHRDNYILKPWMWIINVSEAWIWNACNFRKVSFLRAQTTTTRWAKNSGAINIYSSSPLDNNITEWWSSRRLSGRFNLLLSSAATCSAEVVKEVSRWLLYCLDMQFLLVFHEENF